MAVFYDAIGSGGQLNSPNLTLIPFNMSWNHTARGGQIAVIAAVSYRIGMTTSLSGITREVTYGGEPMTSLGVVQWSGLTLETTTKGAWLELFGITGVPEGTSSVMVKIRGGAALTGRIGRGNTISYSGVNGFGTFTSGSGTNTSMSVSSSATSASASFAAFTAYGSGISTFNRNTRYQSNVNMALAAGDVDGNGSSQSFTATRGGAGEWGACAVSIQAADIVATALPVVVDPNTSAIGKRYPRSPSFVRRSVFRVEPEK
ncbi:MAG: hypothetical protein ACKODT_07290 [Fluviibacter sp.]